MELEFTEESAAAFMQMNERIAQCTFGTRALNACNELTHLSAIDLRMCATLCLPLSWERANGGRMVCTVKSL